MDTVKINGQQQSFYQSAEKKRIDTYGKWYGAIIENMQQKKNISILDVGGGAGFFARWLRDEIQGGIEGTHLKIVVIDSVRYETWGEKKGQEQIEYVLCDAVDIGNVFKEDCFDYIFCNMFVHHLIGRNFRESDKIRKTVFFNLRKVLKAEGRILVVDNINSGLFFDEASSRILFALTTCKNPVVKKILYFLGSHSAGNGVCMLSEKMWEKLIAETGLEIEQLKLTKPNSWNILKKILLMSKEYRERILIVVKK